MIIPPNRQDQLLEDGRPTPRFSNVLEEMADTINDLVALPVNIQDSDYTFVLEDAVVRKTSTTINRVYTIPSNDEVAFDLGRRLEVQNDGSVAMKVAITDDTMTFESDGTTGTRTIGPGGSGRFLKVATTNWKCRGQQMS
jgi:hypothetical protein